MEHEPRPATHMEKQVGWAHKLVGAESLGISKLGQMVLAWMMESQICLQLASSVGVKFRKGKMASALLDGRLFSFSLYTTGAFQAATLELEL